MAAGPHAAMHACLCAQSCKLIYICTIVYNWSRRVGASRPHARTVHKNQCQRARCAEVAQSAAVGEPCPDSLKRPDDGCNMCWRRMQNCCCSCGRLGLARHKFSGSHVPVAVPLFAMPFILLHTHGTATQPQLGRVPRDGQAQWPPLGRVGAGRLVWWWAAVPLKAAFLQPVHGSHVPSAQKDTGHWLRPVCCAACTGVPAGAARDRIGTPSQLLEQRQCDTAPNLRAVAAAVRTVAPCCRASAASTHGRAATLLPVIRSVKAGAAAAWWPRTGRPRSRLSSLSRPSPPLLPPPTSDTLPLPAPARLYRTMEPRKWQPPQVLCMLRQTAACPRAAG